MKKPLRSLSLLVPECVVINMRCIDCPLHYLENEDDIICSCLINNMDDMIKIINKEDK